MNISFISLIIAAALLGMLCIAWTKGFNFRRSRRQHSRGFVILHDLTLARRLRHAFAILIAGLMPHAHGSQVLANFNSGEHQDGTIRYVADNAFANAGTNNGRFLVARQTGATTIDVGTAAGEPLGICIDAPIAAEEGSVRVFGSAKGTMRGIASAAIAVGADVYTAANGLLQSEPALAGTYWLVGTAVSAAVGANDDFEFTHCKPVRVVVVAALASVQNATAAAVDLATSEALANALKANYNTLQTDVANLHTALAAPALIKWL